MKGFNCWSLFMALCLSQTLVGVTAHISVVYYNTGLSDWEILLGRDVGTAIWDDYIVTGTGDLVSIAQEALHDQTGWLYTQNNASLKGIKPITLYGDHHFFIVPVTIRFSGLALRKARNRAKTDFTWIKVQDLVGSGDIIKMPVKRKPERITVEPGFRYAFRQVWSEWQKSLEGCVDSKTTATERAQTDSLVTGT